MDLLVPERIAAIAIQADHVLALFLFIRGSEKNAFAHDNRRPMSRLESRFQEHFLFRSIREAAWLATIPSRCVPRHQGQSEASRERPSVPGAAENANWVQEEASSEWLRSREKDEIVLAWWGGLVDL